MRSEIVAFCEDVLDPELRALRAERDRLARLYAIRRHWLEERQRQASRAADMDIRLYWFVRDETERARAAGAEAGRAIAARVGRVA